MFGLDRRILVLALARMADALGNSFLIVVLPLYVASDAVTGSTFGLPRPAIAGLVLGLFGIVSSSIQPFAGRLSDRAGQRKSFIIGGLLVFGTANFAFSLADGYLSLIVVRALQGLAAALTVTASIALVNEFSLGGSRGGNMGIYNAFRLVGFGAGPLAAGVLIEAGPYTLPGLGTPLSGFTAAFYLAAGAAFLSAALVGIFVEDPDDLQPAERSLAFAIRSPEAGRWLDPVFTLGCATWCMTTCIALLSSIEPEVNERLGQGPVLFSVEFAALVAALAIVQPIVGRASDRRGRKPFILLGLIGLMPSTLVQGVVLEPWQLIAARIVQGAFGAMVLAPALALAGDLARKGQSGATLSVLTMAFGLGIAAGQLAAGFLIEFGFIVPFAFGAGLAGLGLILVQTQVHEPQRAEA